MHLLIGLASGGGWGGAMGMSGSYLPMGSCIDYIRVCQSPEIMDITGQE